MTRLLAWLVICMFVLGLFLGVLYVVANAPLLVIEIEGGAVLAALIVVAAAMYLDR